ncbi:hypothetical protein PIB30_065244 [Stylosanthes scabra]|uniref:Uncharacterized protein n=1 Tax=Stylosanthes scabra TaxID=79078 RepID=A0ABU6QLR7_9FABA|nr:hypothetical protein [Stylosanthes scabra]
MGNGSSVSQEQEELRRLTDAATKREKELQETINKLQESERERRSLVEMLTSNLEDTKKKLFVSDSKVRQLEIQLHEERLTIAHGVKKIGELEQEKRRLIKELESEKAAREEALSKVSVLELEISAAMRDLDSERRRLRGARERLKLQETQLRAFHSTCEVIQILFARQQEQLKCMQRTLEEEEHGVVSRTSGGEKQVAEDHSDNDVKAGTSTTVQKHDDRDQFQASSNEANVIENHDSDVKCEEPQNTQEADQVQSVTEKHHSDIRSEECQNAHETDQFQTSANEASVTEKPHSDVRSEECRNAHETDQVQTSANEASVTEKPHSDVRNEEYRNTHETDQAQTSTNEVSVTEKPHSDISSEESRSTHETDQVNASINKASSTEKRHSDIRSQECQNTQEEDQIQSSINEGSVTRKHDSDIRGEKRQNTHDFNSEDHDHDVRGGFGSDSDVVGPAASVMKGYAESTKPVLKTESCTNHIEQNIDLNEGGPLDMDTRQFDKSINAQETEEHAQRPYDKVLHLSQTYFPIETEKATKDNKAGEAIRTADLLTSEVDDSCGGILKDSNIVMAKCLSTFSDDAAAGQKEQQEYLHLI